MGLLLKLAQIKHAFHTTKINKTGKNTFAGYEYFELADFITVIEKEMHDKKVFSFTNFTDTVATLTILDCESEEKLELNCPVSTATLKGCHPVQNLGAVQTYTRRYLYISLFDIIETDAIEQQTGKETTTQTKPPMPPKQQNLPPVSVISAEQLKMLHATITEHKIENSIVKAYCLKNFNITSSKDLTKQQLDILLKTIKDGTVKNI